MNNTILCRTLLGKKNLDFSIECLASLHQNSFYPVKLEVFEDGTLQAEDVSKIKFALKNTTVITKKERDIVIAEKLCNYKKCQEFRSNNFFAFKILDTMLYGADDFFYVDSDVYFTKKFVFPDFEGYPIFMMDSIHGYIFKPISFFNVNTSILPSANAGFMHYPNKLFKAENLEHLLIKYFKPPAMYHWWAEQTLWAFIGASNEKCYYFDGSQVRMSSDNLKLTDQTLCVHLISPARHKFDYIKNASGSLEQNLTYTKMNVIEIKKSLSPVKYLADWMYNKYRSGLRRLKLKVGNLHFTIL